MRDFRKLVMWQKAHQLTLLVYKATGSFPKEELFGLSSQIRRSAVSIPSNIAEGCGRTTNAELVRFLEISMGSASELDYQLLLAHDLGYLSNEIYDQLSHQTIEVKKMIHTCAQTLRGNG